MINTQNLSVLGSVNATHGHAVGLPTFKNSTTNLLDTLVETTPKNTWFRFEKLVKDVGWSRGLYPRVDRDKRSILVVLDFMFEGFSRLKRPKN